MGSSEAPGTGETPVVSETPVAGGTPIAEGTPDPGAAPDTGGSAGAGGGSVIDPAAPLTPVAFFPSKGRTGACADASVSIQFNRTPVINSGGTIQIHEAGGAVFDSVTSRLQDDLYFSDRVPRSTAGQTFNSEALDVVFDTVVFHPRGRLSYGQTYYITVDAGMITDALGTPFSVQQSDNWTFTVRPEPPASSDSYVLAADGSGDFCSLEGVLEELPNASPTPRVVSVGAGVYPGIARMSESNVVFRGAGIDKSVFAPKNSTFMNASREGIVLTGSDVTFENLTIFNTYLQDSNGQQAEALAVSPGSQRVFLDRVHLRSHQDTLRVDGGSVYMRGGKISGSTDPLWGTGAFYCDGCELSSRTSGHAFVVARSTRGFALVNCSVTRDVASVENTSLAQYHDGREPGRIAFVGCKIDDHIVGWRRPENNAWFEYENTDLKTGSPVTFNATQLNAASPELAALSSPQSWLGWAP